jgi:aminoglycoside phosphotransferase (APT) family kinase protein
MSTFSPLTSAEELLAAAARHGLHITPEGSTLDTVGLDFLVVHGRDPEGTRWIVRSPRRAEVVAAAAREARTLQAIAATLPVRTPEWRIHAPDIIAYPRLDGVPAVEVAGGAPTWNLDQASPPPVFLDSLADLLAALHAIPIDGMEGRGVRVVSPEGERAQVAESVAIGIELLQPSPSTVARWERWVSDPASWPGHVAFAHADLHPGHLLLDDEKRITAVLDWTEAAITDPGIDFAMVHMCFPGSLDAVIERFVARGGRVWPGMATHAVERAAAFPALGAAWAHRAGGNPGVIEHCKAQLAAMEAAST